MTTEKCIERNTENYWSCKCQGLATVQAMRTVACPVCGGNDAGWRRVTVNMINTAIAEAGNAYVEALSTDQPAHVTSALYLRWWSLENPVAMWADAPRPTGFVWREIISFTGYATSGPWGKAYVFDRRGTGRWSYKLYLSDLDAYLVRLRPFQSCTEAQKAVEALVTRWEKGGRDE